MKSGLNPDLSRYIQVFHNTLIVENWMILSNRLTENINYCITNIQSHDTKHTRPTPSDVMNRGVLLGQQSRC